MRECGQQKLWAITKTVSNDTFETVFICGKLGELKPDLTTTAHFAIQLSYPMSYLQHPLQSSAGGLFILVKGVGVNVQRGGGLAVAEDARYRGHIRTARDHQAMQKATTTFNKLGRCLSLLLIQFYLCYRKP